jgi:hypothetical protein
MATNADTKALSLRAEALAILQEAEVLDGLKPFIVVHQQADRNDVYMCWAGARPSCDEVEAMLDAKFEPAMGEKLITEQIDSLKEVAGTLLSRRIADVLAYEPLAQRAQPSRKTPSP